MKTVHDISFKNKRALIRVDFNVPLDKNMQVTNTHRIQATVPTIQKILQDGGCCVLMSHLGRPKGEPSEKYSLKHTLEETSKYVGTNIKFADDCMGQKAFDMSSQLKPGEVLLLENLRFYKEEEKGDKHFAKKLSQHGDVYVNDAFGAAHRAHASTTVVAQFFQDKCAGLVLSAEIANAQQVLSNAQPPFTAIMGGAKISDKILIIEKLLDRVDHLIIGGGMAYTFHKALGGEVGQSMVEEDKQDIARKLIQQAKEKKVYLHLPQDSIVADQFEEGAQTAIVENHIIPKGWMGLDIGPRACKSFSDVISKSKTILWNGPMGVFEMEKFRLGTKVICEVITQATKKGAFSLIGGGDSAAAVSLFQASNQVSYVSTGGGALLEYFEGKTLPGIQALT